MGIEISAFAWVPDFARGYVRDLRPRWALTEAGLDYDVRRLTFEDKETPEYRAWQPFGQVPAYRDGTVELFESGAMLLHIADLSDKLRPVDAQDEAQTRAWVIAALNSVEPQVNDMILPGLFHAGEDWVAGWRPHAEELLAARLTSLSGWLEGREWLCARFGVADILMATILRMVESDLVFTRQPVLTAYLERCLARPGFRQAVEAQIADFAETAPA